MLTVRKQLPVPWHHSRRRLKISRESAKSRSSSVSRRGRGRAKGKRSHQAARDTSRAKVLYIFYQTFSLFNS